MARRPTRRSQPARIEGRDWSPRSSTRSRTGPRCAPRSRSGIRGLGAADVGALPAPDAVARGWQVQLDRGLRVEVPDPALQAAIDAAAPATVLAGQAWKVDPAVVAVLEDWGLDAEATVGWYRLTGRERRRMARRQPATGSWAGVRALAPDGPRGVAVGGARRRGHRRRRHRGPARRLAGGVGRPDVRRP